MCVKELKLQLTVVYAWLFVGLKSLESSEVLLLATGFHLLKFAALVQSCAHGTDEKPDTHKSQEVVLFLSCAEPMNNVASESGPLETQS